MLVSTMEDIKYWCFKSVGLGWSWPLKFPATQETHIDIDGLAMRLINKLVLCYVIAKEDMQHSVASVLGIRVFLINRPNCLLQLQLENSEQVGLFGTEDWWPNLNSAHTHTKAMIVHIHIVRSHTVCWSLRLSPACAGWRGHWAEPLNFTVQFGFA